MIDLLQTPDGDMMLVNGDIVYGESTIQHQRDLLLANPGDCRHAPLVGVGVENYMDDDDPENLHRSIRRQFAADGMTLTKVSVNNGNIDIDAYYKD